MLTYLPVHLKGSVVGRLGMMQAAIHEAVPLLNASLCPRLASVGASGARRSSKLSTVEQG